ncbi:hypothetical protein V499_07394 [Pseudogymnoascus sp. VKM F-103]|nr:hypothetical protein V499_07394 [Pseudogymnoascus sp. VKM F-103]
MLDVGFSSDPPAQRLYMVFRDPNSMPAVAHRRPTADNATHDEAALKREGTPRAAPLRLRGLELGLAGGGVKDEGRD